MSPVVRAGMTVYDGLLRVSPNAGAEAGSATPGRSAPRADLTVMPAVDRADPRRPPRRPDACRGPRITLATPADGAGGPVPIGAEGPPSQHPRPSAWAPVPRSTPGSSRDARWTSVATSWGARRSATSTAGGTSGSSPSWWPCSPSSRASRSSPCVAWCPAGPPVCVLAAPTSCRRGRTARRPGRRSGPGGRRGAPASRGGSSSPRSRGRGWAALVGWPPPSSRRARPATVRSVVPFPHQHVLTPSPSSASSVVSAATTVTVGSYRSGGAEYPFPAGAGGPSGRRRPSSRWWLVARFPPAPGTLDQLRGPSSSPAWPSSEGSVIVFLVYPPAARRARPFDAFHEGEHSQWRTLMGEGAFPWRDVLFIHGPAVRRRDPRRRAADLRGHPVGHARRCRHRRWAGV